MRSITQIHPESDRLKLNRLVICEIDFIREICFNPWNPD